MGGGGWDPTSYAATRSSFKASGASPFAHSTAIKTGAVAAAVHPDLDPKHLNTFDKKVRECFDSDDHPNTTPIAVLFDETGSMGGIPVRLQDKLANLFGLLLRKGYCEDPQIMVGAIGDAANREAAPLQVSQFEADNRVDEALRNIYLEGNGGGNGRESYELAMWFLANFVDLDSVKKRGKKGYLFIIGDEKAQLQLEPSIVRTYVGEEINEAIPLDRIIEKLKETWEVFWIYPKEATYFGQADYPQFWRDRFGEHTIFVDDIENICETIGTAIGLFEGAIDDLDDAAADLAEIGAGSATGTVSKALAHLAGSTSGAVATSAAPADLGGAGAARL